MHNGRTGSRAAWLVLLAGGLAVSACAPTSPEAGRALFSEYCASCHGSGAKGDGPMAAHLGKKPADLTAIAQRNGGTFPMARVMSTIDGYTRRNDHGSVMPEMGPVLPAGPLVRMDTGDGIMTPVPANLAALAHYLETLQTK